MTMPPLPRPPEDIANDAWNAVQEGRPESVSGPFGGTIMEMHLRDDAGAIDPAFARRLGARLRQRAQLGAADTAPLPPRPLQPIPLADDAGSGAHHWLTAALVALAAAVVVALLGGPTLIDRSRGGGGIRVAKVATASPVVAPQVIFDGPDVGLLRGNPARTGEVVGSGPNGDPIVRWRSVSEGLLLDGRLVPGDGELFGIRAYMSNGERTLVAIDAVTGQERTVATLDEYDSFVGAVVDGKVIIPSGLGPPSGIGNGVIKARDVMTGNEIWTYRHTAGFDATSLLVVENTMYVTTGDETLRAVDVRSGIQEWSAPIPTLETGNGTATGLKANTPLVFADGTIFGIAAGYVYAVDATDGRTLWATAVAGVVTRPALVSDGVFVVATNDTSTADPGIGMPGRVYGLDASSGAPVWETIERPTGVNLAAADGQLFVASWEQLGGTLDAYDIFSGARRWTFSRARGFLEPVIAGGWLWVSSPGDGTVQRIDPSTGQATWSVYLAGGPPVINGDALIVAGRSGLLSIEGGAMSDEVGVASGSPDLSGLAPCFLPRELGESPFIGAPTASLAVESRIPSTGGGTYEDGRTIPHVNWPRMRVADLPSGSAVDSETMSRIRVVLRNLEDCADRPEGFLLVRGFFTDDFFRRGVAAETPLGYWLPWSGPEQPTAEELDMLVGFTLTDGRVAIVTRVPGDPDAIPGSMIVFAEQDGQWLIDEVFRIVVEFDSRELG